MIKRRFYKVEHGDKDDPSASSSSSSSEGTEPQEPDPSSSLSGYASEANSSENEVEVESKGGSSPAGHSDDSETPIDVQNSSVFLSKDDDYDGSGNDYMLKCKSVFKCRICPRIVCLNEESLKSHLQSKRHIRSVKLLNDGRLKSMLNSDGEVEDQETAAEMNARIVSMAKDNPIKRKKLKLEGSKRSRKKVREAGDNSGVVDEKEVLAKPKPSKNHVVKK